MAIIKLCDNLECGAKVSGESTKYCKFCSTPKARQEQHDENNKIRVAAGLKVND